MGNCSLAQIISSITTFFKYIVVIRSIMKCVALALIAFTAVASAEPGYGYGHHLGYGYGHHLGYGYGHYLGKRSADAEPAADAEPTAAAEPGYAYGAYGLGHAYGYGHLGY